MRLDYGSRLYELVDRPINRALFVDIYVAVAEALKQWERRITVKRVQVESIDQANITLVIEGSYRANNQSFRLEGVAI